MRINPYELHVADSEFWDTLYGPGRVDKYEYFINRQNIPRSIFATPDHNLHKLRKAPLLPLFSKRRISEFQPVIREKLDILCSKIDQYVGPFALNRALTAFSGDVITTYVFGQSYQHLESPDFKETFHEPFMAASESGHVALQFKWVYPLMESLPEWLVLKMQPQIFLILQLAKVSTVIVVVRSDRSGLRCQTQSYSRGQGGCYDIERIAPERSSTTREGDRQAERGGSAFGCCWVDDCGMGNVCDGLSHYQLVDRV